jgi:hypothetical protein
MEGHSVSNIEYRDDVRVLHVHPVTHQKVQILQGRSLPDVSKLESIAATSELFKHRNLDATLVVHATNRKHDDRYHFYWYFTIPILIVILLAIMICNGYSYLLRNLLHKVHCTTQPAENSTPGNESRSLSKVSPEQQPSTSQLQSNESGRKSEFVTYPVQRAAWSRYFELTGQAKGKTRVDYFFLLTFFSIAKKQRKSPNAWWKVHSANMCECQICVLCALSKEIRV